MTDHRDSRRARAAAAWGLTDEIVLVGAGDLIPIPGHADQLYPFRAHAEYFWLADRERPGCVLAFDPRDGWTDFVPRVTEQQRVWAGGSVSDEGVPLTGLEAWLNVRAGRTTAMLGCPVEAEAEKDLTDALRAKLTHARRAKDDVELDRMRRAARATADGFEVASKLCLPGTTERRIQIEIEAEFFRGGAQRTAYDTIVGSGPNSAILHVHPSKRVLQRGELVLIDAGGEVDGYACDVTRTYPVGGEFTAEQRDLYDLVLATEEAAVKKCRAGVEYREIHMEASLALARGLVDFGLLKGSADAAVDTDAHALFFPHGIGHMVGLGVRDASGYLPGRKRSDRPGLKFLRTDLPLLPGYTLTIEPGIYFIPTLLADPERREKFANAVDWERVDKMLDFGGIRIEDDVLVTDGDPEILTAAIPK